jgi:glycopeptide antibiotics resistance protein
MDKAKRNNTLTLVLFIVYILTLIWIILFKLHFSFAEIDRVSIINLIPFQGLTAIGANEIYNIVFFIPFGIYICMLKNKWSFIIKVIIIFCLSLSFEIVQFIFAIGRSDITDLLCNTLGGITGIGIYALSFKILKNKTNKVLNIVFLVLTVCILLFFALLVTHSLPLIINL